MAESLPLFGGSKPFAPPPWKTTDDRVRGGSSQSYLSPLEDNSAAFYGNLDITTLGGAGFASQSSPENVARKDDQARTSDHDGDSNSTNAWNLSAYAGVEIAFAQGDDKVYTFILRDDESVEKREDGREQAGINWEVEFKAPKGGGTVWKAWKDFKATYRGKEKKDVGNLKTEYVRRIGIMMRSYFGTQEGEFRLTLQSISARKDPRKPSVGSVAPQTDLQRLKESMI